MAQIISFHSYHDGTGKSTVAANLGAIMAAQGLRVCIVDADTQSPSLQIIFNMDGAENKPSLCDYLWGQCDIEAAVNEVTHFLDFEIKGQIFLVLMGTKAGDIARMRRDGDSVTRLYTGFKRLITFLNLDILLIDMPAGLGEENLLTIGISDVLIEIMRPDQQDYQGTTVIIDTIQELGVPKTLLVMNQVSRRFDCDKVRNRVERVFNYEVGAMLPFSEEIAGNSRLFSLQDPDHSITLELKRFADSIIKLPCNSQGHSSNLFPENHKETDSSLNKQQVTVTLTAESWNAIMDFIKYSCQLKGEEWVEWGQQVNQIILSSIEKSGEENFVTGIKRTAISSSNLNSVGYDVKTKTLEIKFNGGSIYQYYQVPQEIYVGLMTAESHGNYFYTIIRNTFQFRKVGYEPSQNYREDDNFGEEDYDASDFKSELKADVGLDASDEEFDTWYDELDNERD